MYTPAIEPMRIARSVVSSRIPLAAEILVSSKTSGRIPYFAGEKNALWVADRKSTPSRKGMLRIANPIVAIDMTTISGTLVHSNTRCLAKRSDRYPANGEKSRKGIGNSAVARLEYRTWRASPLTAEIKNNTRVTFSALSLAAPSACAARNARKRGERMPIFAAARSADAGLLVSSPIAAADFTTSYELRLVTDLNISVPFMRSDAVVHVHTVIAKG